MSVLARSSSTDRRYFGVVEAVVIDNLDPEKEGKIKVRFPWFDEYTNSEWCRVCQFYAGPNQSGAFFVPELESEVLVAFIHGDMRHPVIVGSLYNGVDKPATSRDDDRDEKQIQTRSGHRITLVDTEGKETIVIVDRSGRHSIEVSTVDSGIAIRSQGGKLTLEANEIEITADAGVKIAGASIEARADGNMVLKGTRIDLN